MSKQRKCPGAGQTTTESRQFAGDWAACPVCQKRVRITWDGVIGYHMSTATRTEARKVVDYEFTAEGMRPIYADEAPDA